MHLTNNRPYCIRFIDFINYYLFVFDKFVWSVDTMYDVRDPIALVNAGRTNQITTNPLISLIHSFGHLPPLSPHRPPFSTWTHIAFMSNRFAAHIEWKLTNLQHAFHFCYGSSFPHAKYICERIATSIEQRAMNNGQRATCISILANETWINNNQFDTLPLLFPSIRRVGNNNIYGSLNTVAH